MKKKSHRQKNVQILVYFIIFFYCTFAHVKKKHYLCALFVFFIILINLFTYETSNYFVD